MTFSQGNRLKGILEGPWTNEARDAHTFLRPPEGLVTALLGQDNITVRDLTAKEKAEIPKQRSKEIKQFLRAHWKSKKGIVDPVEIHIRDSFDEALTSLQLLELAAESAYLPEDVVVATGKGRLLNLLWPAGARSFVSDYDYLGVRFLAARCNMDLGLPEVSSPSPDPQAQVQFATFLSQHEGWYGNESLDWWLGLLDDYIDEDDEFEEPEDEAFYRFLRSGELPCANQHVERRFYERADGLNRFLFLLSNLFSFLPPEASPVYGSLYLYWMAKFFGYELGDDGYRRDSDLYYDWSRAAKGQVLCPTPPRQKAVEKQIKVIQAGFKSTKNFVKNHL